VSKNKLQKFAENLSFRYLFQPSAPELLADGFPLKGRWRSDFFGNDNPIVLELGCGKGDYSVALAKEYPELNFIGIDIKGARLWRGCKTAEEFGLNNVAFVRTKIQNLDLLFGKDEVDEIWITFPDPQPKNSKADKRLSSAPFLARYSSVMRPGGLIHLKTDNAPLYDFTLELITAEKHQIVESSRDVYSDGLGAPITTIQTFYEKIWLDAGLKIHYLSFKLNPDAGFRQQDRFLHPGI
jgi:tRNA (guanine-N7-)-methyltransferase